MAKEEVKLWDCVPGHDYIAEFDLPELHSWFLDATHAVPPWTPLYGWFWVRYCGHGMKYAANALSIPTCKGWEWRFKDGGGYCAFLIVRDEKERKEREAKFREALRPWLEDFDGVWGKYKQELLGMYEGLKAIDLEKASNADLLHHNFELIDAYRRMWEIHFQGMYASYNAWLLFEEICKERFGLTDQSPEFQKLMRGFDNKVFQIDKRLWEFGQLAVENDLKSIFEENGPKDIPSKLEETKAGKGWLKEFYNFLETDEIGGWRMVRMNELLEPYWLEDISVPMTLVQGFLRKNEFPLDKVRDGLAREREEAIESLLQKVGEDERGWFEKLIRLAGKASSYSEEHDLYCELCIQALMRRGYSGIGKRLVQAGTIDESEDVFFLNPDEIERVMLAPEVHNLRPIVKRRRAEWKEWQQRPNPPVLTDRESMEKAMELDMMPSRDAVAIKIVVGDMPEVRPQLKADLYGLAASPGIVEGLARVIFSFDRIGEVQPGEILVAPGTNPAWTPAFYMIKAAVVDRGGLLSHSAIVGRECGIPVVVNVFEGTTKIKTGQNIRVDGDKGVVYILD